MWTEIARANTADELQYIEPAYADVPADTEVNIRLELQWWAPIGKLADLAGAEWWAPKLAQADLDVIDVSGDTYYIDIRGTARGMPVIVLLAVLATAVAVLGIGAWVSTVVITANIEQKKLEQANQWLDAGYTPEQVSQMLNSATFKPLDLNAPAIAGISAGVVLAGIVVLLLLLRR